MVACLPVRLWCRLHRVQGGGWSERKKTAPKCTFPRRGSQAGPMYDVRCHLHVKRFYVAGNDQ